jgi:hypothetical protein
MLQYVIEAYSAQANQTLRQISLNNQTITAETNRLQADNTARTFAYTLNQQAKLNATDWVGTATLQELGGWAS